MPRQSMRNIGIRNILWSLVCALFAAGICSAQTVLYFPQVVDGVQAGAGVGWLMSGFGVSVDPAGADESCVRPGTARTAALMRARTKGNIGQ